MRWGILLTGGSSHRARNRLALYWACCAAHVFHAFSGEMDRNREGARASFPRRSGIFSFFGGLLLLAYAVYRADPVFILGQATGLAIYSRNIYFIWLGKRAAVSVTAT